MYVDSTRAQKRTNIVLNGRFISRLPFGYTLSDEGLLCRHPEDGHKVLAMFWLYSLNTPTQRLSTKKIGAYFGISQRLCCRILRNRFYLGELSWRGETIPAHHIPLVGETLFAAVGNKLSKHRNTAYESQVETFEPSIMQMQVFIDTTIPCFTRTRDEVKRVALLFEQSQWR